MQPFHLFVLDAKGNLYGAAFQSGAAGDGVVFKLAASGKVTLLDKFTGMPDGQFPAGDLLMDAKGNLYGTAELGGASNSGVVFKLIP